MVFCLRRVRTALWTPLMVLFTGACSGPPPMVGAAATGQVLDAVRLAVEDARTEGLTPLVDTLLLLELTNRAAPAIGSAEALVNSPGLVAIVGHSNSAAGPVDVIVSDVKMPGESGVAFYDWVRVAHPELADRFLFVTGDVRAEELVPFAEEHPDALILKPFEMEDYLNHVRTLLNSLPTR